jgi:hypothetical protein
MIVDIVGSVKQLVMWAVKEVLLLLSIILFGLSAPLLFTVGAEVLVWQNPADMGWVPAYFLIGPFACAIWMVFICHFQSVRQWQRMGKQATWREDHGGIFHTAGKSVWFMVSGFFGSAVAEAIFLFGISAMFQHAGDRASLMLCFAVAPFFVFAPVLLVILKRCVRKDDRLIVSY